MSNDGLAQRREWYRFFPQGSLEFVLITRVLGLALLVALVVVHESQRSLVLFGLLAMLWADYQLTLWWTVQVATDLNAMAAAAPPTSDALRHARVTTAALAMLPATMAVLILAPWSAGIPLIPVAATSLIGRLVPLLCVLFVVLLLPAYRALRRVKLGPTVWTLLLLVPVVHWLALHRLMRQLHARIRAAAPAAEVQPNVAIPLADAAWVLSVLPWTILVIVLLIRGQLLGTLPYSVLPVCGTLLAVVFAVADLAAMENVQRRFVDLLRKK